MYRQMPEVKSYQQYHLSDRRKDDSEEPIDGVAQQPRQHFTLRGRVGAIASWDLVRRGVEGSRVEPTAS